MAGSERLFEVDKLDISVSDEGFIVGIDHVGSLIGADSPIRTDVTGQITSLTITHTRAVDDDLFLRTEASTMTMAARYEDSPVALNNRSIVVQYDGQGELFRGRVVSSNRDVVVDPSGPDHRRWTVSLAATTGDDRAVGYIIRQPTAPSGSIEDVILDRVPFISTVEVHEDLDLDDIVIAAGHDDSMEVKELFTRIERVASIIVRQKPGSPGTIQLLPYDFGPTWELEDNTGSKPSFTRMSLRNEMRAATSVKVSPMHRPDEVPEEDPDLTVLRTLPGAVRNDKEFQVDVPWDSTKLQAAAADMPIKRALAEYITSVSMPFDPRLDTSDQPTRLVVWLDGTRREAAVVGVTHTILPGNPRSGVPSTWRVDLTCAPIHLLTRESDT